MLQISWPSHNHTIVEDMIKMDFAFVVVYCVLVVGLESGHIEAESPQFTHERKEEVCSDEEFSANCGYNEALLITRASFGHLYLGRCIDRDFGLFGCGSDVTSFVSTRCTGKRSCKIPLNDPDLNSLEPECASGLRIFADIKYVCVRGSPERELCSTKAVKERASFFFSHAAQEEQCIQQNGQSFVELAAKKGQSIRIKIIDMSTGDILQNNTKDAGLGHVVDGGREGEFMYTRTAAGQLQGVYTSQSHAVTLVLQENDGNLLVTYTATGCLEFLPPPNTWSERNGDVLIVKCYKSDQSWSLTCVGTKWIGVIGNCTVKEVKISTVQPPVVIVEEENIPEDTSLGKGSVAKALEIIVVIIAAVTVLMCTIVILVGFLCVKLAKRSYNGSKDYQKCEVIPMDASLTRSFGPTEVNDENIRAWQQSLTSNPSMSRSQLRNNGPQMIIMDKDLITINGINNA